MKTVIEECARQLTMPYVIETDVEYYETIGDKLDVFRKLLIELKADDEIVKTATNFRKSLLEVIRHYYKGSIANAQIQMGNIIKGIIKSDDKAETYIKDSVVFDGTTIRIPFFRARLDADEDGYRASEMGAIPFYLRTKANIERFSMPGFPCLYIGNTSYACWLEMGKPEDHRFNVSPLYLDGKQRVFDMGIGCGEVYNIVQTSESDGRSYLIKDNLSVGLIKRIMLTMASSFRVIEKERVFKSEYMVPQMVMLACHKLGVDGVLYFSCKTPHMEITAVNIALFSKYPGNRFSPDSKESDIAGHIKIGDSYNYSLFKQYKRISAVASRPDILWIDSCNWMKQVDLQNNISDYREMLFHEFDVQLIEMWKKKHPEDFKEMETW